MEEQRSSRSKQLIELGHVGMKSLIKEPVKEAVREALREERLAADDHDQHRQARPNRSDDEDATADGSWFRRSAVLLPVLGVVALGAIAGRRRLIELANERGVVDQSDEMDATEAMNRTSPAASDHMDAAESASHGGHGDDLNPDE